MQRLNIFISGFLYLILLIAICSWDSVVIASEHPRSTESLTTQFTETSQDANVPNNSLQAPRPQQVGCAPHTKKEMVGKAHPTTSYVLSPESFTGWKPVPQQLLWQNRISVPENQKDTKYRNELRRLIEQIRSIQFEPKNQEPKAVIPKHFGIEPAPIRGSTELSREPRDTPSEVSRREPNETSLVTKSPQEHIEKEIPPEPDNELPYQPISNKTLKMLENISQHPDQLHNPLELAEILFRSNYLKHASVCYEQALKRNDPNVVKSAQDRAWLLFQIGNCLRADDLPTASKMYRQLIAEHPDSTWTDLAKAQEGLINWYLSEKPQTLIAGAK